jgi:hypothetical protein
MWICTLINVHFFIGHDGSLVVRLAEGDYENGWFAVRYKKQGWFGQA